MGAGVVTGAETGASESAGASVGGTRGGEGAGAGASASARTGAGADVGGTDAGASGVDVESRIGWVEMSEIGVGCQRGDGSGVDRGCRQTGTGHSGRGSGDGRRGGLGWSRWYGCCYLSPGVLR